MDGHAAEKVRFALSRLHEHDSLNQPSILYSFVSSTVADIEYRSSIRAVFELVYLVRINEDALVYAVAKFCC